jgi:hypothetical protein
VNVHAPSEEKSDVSNDALYEELEQVFSQPPKYHMTIQLGDLDTKFGTEYIFTPTIWSESLHQECNVNASIHKMVMALE